MSITVNIYILKKNEESLIETFEQDLNIKMIDFKEKLQKKYFPDNNYLEIHNINERVYKDYGMLFFDKGLLPDTNDNYMLNKFTIPNRTFSFLINGKNVEKKIIPKPKRINFNKYNTPTNNDQKEEVFVFKEEDFPPLC